MRNARYANDAKPSAVAGFNFTINWQTYTVGSHRTSCPACGRGKTDKTMGITIDRDGSGVAHCFRCSHVEHYRPKTQGVVMRAAAPPRQSVFSTEKRTSLSQAGRDLWASCIAVSSTAEAYLKSRRCRIPPADSHLKWHPSLKHPNGYCGPCLVALITHAQTCEPLSLHRTWITATGKADVGDGGQSRLVLGGHSTKGGVIRLWPDDYVTGGLGIAEGIETALSLAFAYPPVWAMIDAGHMAAFPVLAGIDCLTIARDRDPAGEKAAKECARRWKGAGVTVMLSAQKNGDFNDAMAGGAV